MKQLSLAILAIVLASGSIAAGDGWAFVPELLKQENGYSLHQYDGGFDRYTCQENCRSRYGLLPYAAGGGGSSEGRGKYYLFAKCMADCDTKFWKEFDRNMRRLEEE